MDGHEREPSPSGGCDIGEDGLLALDDSRVTLKIGDGFNHVFEAEDQYDLIVLDLTDPGGPSESLYTHDFYRACAVRLKPVGAMTLHIASPVAHPERIRSCIANLRAAFPHVTPYLTSVPLYGGLWMMACVSQTLDPRQFCGSAYGMVAAARGYQHPIGEWNFEEVTVKGSTIKVELNGTVILDADLSKVDMETVMAKSKHPGKDRTSGFFGFAGHSDPART